jgi:DNA-directed RNA polymerase subunit RPC12/RpoP
MIQVLRIGNYVNNSRREYKATCWRCNALLQFDHFDQLDDPIENGIYIRCPQCWAMLEKWRWEEE